MLDLNRPSRPLARPPAPNAQRPAFCISPARSDKRGCEGRLRSNPSSKLRHTAAKGGNSISSPIAKGIPDHYQASQQCPQRLSIPVFELTAPDGTNIATDNHYSSEDLKSSKPPFAPHTRKPPYNPDSLNRPSRPLLRHTAAKGGDSTFFPIAKGIPDYYQASRQCPQRLSIPVFELTAPDGTNIATDNHYSSEDLKSSKPPFAPHTRKSPYNPDSLNRPSRPLLRHTAPEGGNSIFFPLAKGIPDHYQASQQCSQRLSIPVFELTTPDGTRIVSDNNYSSEALENSAAKR